MIDVFKSCFPIFVEINLALHACESDETRLECNLMPIANVMNVSASDCLDTCSYCTFMIRVRFTIKYILPISIRHWLRNLQQKHMLLQVNYFKPVFFQQHAVFCRVLKKTNIVHIVVKALVATTKYRTTCNNAD